jgi:hypothetical protein
LHRCDVLETGHDRQLCIQVEGTGFLLRQARACRRCGRDETHTCAFAHARVLTPRCCCRPFRAQVRNMVGALVHVGHGKAPPEAVARALATCARIPKVKAAPAHGLCLARVFYDDEEDAPRELLAAARAADAQYADEEEDEAAAAPRCAVGTPRTAAAAR